MTHGNQGSRKGDSRADKARRIKADRPHVSYAEIGQLTGMSREGARLACKRQTRSSAQAARHVLPDGALAVGTSVAAAAAQLAALPLHWQATIAADVLQTWAAIHARAVDALTRRRVHARRNATPPKPISVDTQEES